MYKIVFYVPKNDAENVKDSIFSAGAGKIGNYDSCSFETEGIGQFRPLKGSNPTIGAHNKVEKVVELKVETICKKNDLTAVIEALKSSHPYEEPAIDVFELINF